VGARFVFAYPGDPIIELMEATRSAGVEVILGRREDTAASGPLRGAPDNSRSLGGRVVVGLEHEPRHTFVPEAPGQGEVMDGSAPLRPNHHGMASDL
jgi:hypothetical protein